MCSIARSCRASNVPPRNPAILAAVLRHHGRRSAGSTLVRVFTHTFTGADIATPPTPADTGQAMSQIDVGTVATFSRTAGKLTLAVVPANYSVFLADTGKADARSRVKPINGSSGLAFRIVDNANFWMLEAFNFTVGPNLVSLNLNRRLAAVNTTPGTALGTPFNLGDEIIALHVGSSIKVYTTQSGNTPLISIVDGSLATATKFGALSGGSATLQLDDLIQDA